MIETFFEKLIQELGATGILVIGLYWILHRPLERMAHSLRTINEELGKILDIYKNREN